MSEDLADDRTMPTNVYKIQVKIADEPVQFEVRLPDGLATWEHLLPLMRAMIATSSEISQEHFAAQGQYVSCRAGCAMCCHQRVPISVFEAYRIRRLVDSLPEPRRTEVLSRFNAAQERIRLAGESVEIDSDKMSPEELGRQATNYLRYMIPCPFLENNSCSIYEERPLKCREYMVLSPAEYCADPDANPVVGLPLPLSVFLSTLMLNREESTSGTGWIFLTDLITWTDQNPAPEPKHPAPELLRQFMSSLRKPSS